MANRGCFKFCLPQRLPPCNDKDNAIQENSNCNIKKGLFTIHPIKIIEKKACSLSIVHCSLSIVHCPIYYCK